MEKAELARQYGLSGVGQIECAEKIDLENFRNRTVKLLSTISELESLMREVADRTFGLQPSKADDNATKSPIDDTLNSILADLERQVARLRQQCHRF
jgi:hypothetical protein